jgi:hypothetical protein
MINSMNIVPFLEDDIQDLLRAGDTTMTIAVYLANTQRWYWTSQELLALMVRAHEEIHSLGLENTPQHDQAVESLDVLVNALSRADTVVWN